IAAVTPQMSAAPQPPRSNTDQPSDPSKKPGFARQITNPSYQRNVLRRCRSSTAATATTHLLVVRASSRRGLRDSNGGDRNMSPGGIQGPERAGRTIEAVPKPPITI